MNGLHSCKPGNEPVLGQIKTFVVEQRTGKSGKAYTKITSKGADQGGQPYKILSAKPTGHTDSYGNVSFNIEVEPANGAQPTPQASQQQRSNGMSKDDYWARKEQRDIEGQERMGRAHSQEMALRYWSLLARGGALSPEDCKDTPKLRAVIDWFQRDVSHVPEAPSKVERPVEPTLPEDLDEEPF
jgi:hypothetical protein